MSKLGSTRPGAGEDPALRNVVPVNDVIAGGCARAASQSTIHPLDTVKVRMQALVGKAKPVREAAAAQKAAKAVSGVWRQGSSFMATAEANASR